MQLVEHRPKRPIPIRMTPLIDVVFILLVFFMLTSRLLPVGFLELKNATAGSYSTTGDPIPELIVTGTGEVRWQAQSRRLEELIIELLGTGVSEVNLSTQPDASLGDFTHTLSRLDGVGIDTHWKRTTVQTP